MKQDGIERRRFLSLAGASIALAACANRSMTTGGGNSQSAGSLSFGNRNGNSSAQNIPPAAYDPAAYQKLDQSAGSALGQLYASEANIRSLGAISAAVLVFPSISKGGFVIGGMYGDGALFVKRAIVDHYRVIAASAGLQAGIQTFSMALFFKDSNALRNFRMNSGAFDLGANVEYVLKGAGGASYGTSVATFHSPIQAVLFNQSGYMAGASLEGARFSRI